MKYPILICSALILFLNGCVGNMNPTGGNSNPNYPYYTTQHLMTVKKIVVPAGTTLTYEKYRGKEGQQEHLLAEDKLTEIQLPKGQTLDWGGVPVTMIAKFFNSEISEETEIVKSILENEKIEQIIIESFSTNIKEFEVNSLITILFKLCTRVDKIKLSKYYKKIRT